MPLARESKRFSMRGMRTTPFALASLALFTLVACTPKTTTPTTTSDTPDENPHRVTIGWIMEEKETTEYGQTTSSVTLRIGTEAGIEDIALGDFIGCGQQEIPADGALLGLKCWFAGSGDDFQVRMEGTNTLAIDHRIVDAEAPIPEFTNMKTVTIPEGALIVPVTGSSTID